MKLLIAEKPSVARTIATALNVSTIKDGYMEGHEIIITWAFGHLVELVKAEEYNQKYKTWKKEDLPILPKQMKYEVKPSCKEQFALLKKLLNREDIDIVVCATDADREGELIFRLIYELSGSRLPIKRLWLSSMDEKAIVESFKHLLPSDDFYNLYLAAKCRQHADWLIGINFTRLFTTVYGNKLPIGRVMTPTLALVTERDSNIETFKKEKFYQLEVAACDSAGNTIVFLSNKIQSQHEAEFLLDSSKNVSAIAIKDVEKRKKRVRQPELFDLTTMQRFANRYFGYTADNVLQIAQKLYENGLLTYPRTESKYIAQSASGEIGNLCNNVRDLFNMTDDFDPIKIEQVVNDTKVISHPALLPTSKLNNYHFTNLSAEEKNILALVSFRLLEALSAPEEFEETHITAMFGDIEVRAKGKKIDNPGWTRITSLFYRQIEKDEPKEMPSLPSVLTGDNLVKDSAGIKEGETVPPKRFTEDTLLSAMEHASAEEFKSVPNAEHEGLGTPATRAAIIKKLIDNDLMQRKGKQIVSTAKGRTLINVVPDIVKNAVTTAQWEKTLKDIETGAPEKAVIFAGHIEEMINRVIAEYSAIDAGSTTFDAREAIGICPRCGQPVFENKANYKCKNIDCSFVLWKNDRFFTSKKKEINKTMAKQFLKLGKTVVKDLWSEKQNKSYDAVVIMKDTGEKYINFELSFDDRMLEMVKFSKTLKTKQQKPSR